MDDFTAKVFIRSDLNSFPVDRRSHRMSHLLPSHLAMAISPDEALPCHLVEIVWAIEGADDRLSALVPSSIRAFRAGESECFPIAG